MTDSALADLDVFYGELTVHRASIYARLPRPAEDAGLSLAGQVRGPRCLHAQTLPMTSPLVDLGLGPTLLARTLVPDPCFWSPDLPAIYDVTVNLLRGKEIVATARRELGLRSLGVRGRNLFLSGKRWVLRGVTSRSTTATLPRDWHAASAALVASGVRKLPDSAEQLAEASQWGALTLVELAESGPAAVASLRELARFPAVGIAAIKGDLTADFKASQVCPNMLIAQCGPTVPAGQAAPIEDLFWCPSDRDGSDHIRPQPWAQLVLADADNPQRVAQLAAAVEVPVIAIRRLPSALPIEQARAACDTLQRDLAPFTQLAGYIV